MVFLREIESFCDELLHAKSFDDSAVNGIQVDTHRPVKSLVMGVTASAALVEQAVEAGADVVLAHHGLFWAGQSPALRSGLLKRVSPLLKHDIGLLAYHLPLDASIDVGNNAMLGRGLGLTELNPWGRYRGTAIGVSGLLPPTPFDQVLQRIVELAGRPVLHLPGGPEIIRKVAVVSGGAASMALEAGRDGFDLFLTGEPSETSMHIAAEEKIHIVAAGHHATETLGVQELGRLLAQKFGIAARFMDLPNPV